ncbi:MAG: polysaccharide deacetylase family protein [Chromatiales bacterium]|nr:polysaccharide deacetylase family protein [Chromatiales bacterium]
MPATFFFPAWSLKLAPEQVAQVDAAGIHEIAAHGWIHERNSQLDEATERRLAGEVRGRPHRDRRAPPGGVPGPVLELQPQYAHHAPRHGLPLRELAHGRRPALRAAPGRREPTGLVEIPVEWILDDAPLYNVQGANYSPPRDVMQVWIDEFDKAWEERTLFVLTMHPHATGHRSRIVALEGLIDHIQAKGGAWFATHEEAARYVRQQAGMDAPAPPSGAPAGSE